MHVLMLQVLPVLKPVDKCWQPADFLPDSSDPDFLDKVGGQQLQAGGAICTALYMYVRSKLCSCKEAATAAARYEVWFTCVV